MQNRKLTFAGLLLAATLLVFGMSGVLHKAFAQLASSVTPNLLMSNGFQAGAFNQNGQLNTNFTNLDGLLGGMRVTADFTDANSAALQAITGLSYTFPNPQAAQAVSFSCMVMYSQATNVAGDQFGAGLITTAPTSLSATGTVTTNATTSSYGVLTALTTVTPTAIVTFTPAVATVLNAYIDGTVEVPAAAPGSSSVFNLYVLNGTAADVIVVKRGSFCTLF
jgi:hypothetical protein